MPPGRVVVLAVIVELRSSFSRRVFSSFHTARWPVGAPRVTAWSHLIQGYETEMLSLCSTQSSNPVHRSALLLVQLRHQSTGVFCTVQCVARTKNTLSLRLTQREGLQRTLQKPSGMLHYKGTACNVYWQAHC